MPELSTTSQTPSFNCRKSHAKSLQIASRVLAVTWGVANTAKHCRVFHESPRTQPVDQLQIVAVDPRKTMLGCMEESMTGQHVPSVCLCLCVCYTSQSTRECGTASSCTMIGTWVLAISPRPLARHNSAQSSRDPKHSDNACAHRGLRFQTAYGF